MVYSLDTESFINALRRFIARRGLPEQIRSDNAGNFVKGEKELRGALQAWNQAQIHECLLQHDVKWIFNPPAASHFGGVWERCIRTVRKVMKALLKQQVLDDESLHTLMCEVESIVNGRPITKVSDDPRDLNALTPNHLLLLLAGTASHLECFPRMITTPVADGAKCNILAISSGHAGPESTCRHCSNVKSGPSHSVISP